MVFFDASAIVAMILREPGCERLFARLEQGGEFFTSAMALYEAALALGRSVNGGVSEASRDLHDFMVLGCIRTVAIEEEHGYSALRAFELYGKGRHKSKLNLGDCFAYAMTKSRNASILFVGDDFTHTDLPDALAAI